METFSQETVDQALLVLWDRAKNQTEPVMLNAEVFRTGDIAHTDRECHALAEHLQLKGYMALERSDRDAPENRGITFLPEARRRIGQLLPRS